MSRVAIPESVALIAAVERILAGSVAGRNGCVLWTGHVNHAGYGYISVKHRKKSVHRLAFSGFKGAIPEGLEIDHLCRVRNCVNPVHLEAVTHSENLLRSERRRIAIGDKCANGHTYSEETLYLRPDGRQVCKPCKQTVSRNSKRRMRAIKVADGGESRG